MSVVPAGEFVIDEPARPATRGKLQWKLIVGGVIVGAFTVIAIFAPEIAPHRPLATNPIDTLLAPGAGGHLLGTDDLGRDEFSRLIYATRIDLPIAVAAALLSAILGTLLGALAGFAGRWADMVILRIADLVQAFPIYILLIALVFALGPGARSFLIAYIVVDWVVYARLVRGEIMRVRSLDYVSAARAAGLRSRRVLFVHVLPNSISQSVIYVMSDMVFAILALAAFSFLGVGISPPTAEWGAMTAQGQQFLGVAWWLTVCPGVAIAVVALGLSLIGDGLQDRMRR
jgi:peptide/nickel transport system permease protein